MSKIIVDESLLIPQIVLDPQTGKEAVIGFDVKTLLDSRQDRDLSGVLLDDFLGGIEWGIIPLQPHKVRRWMKYNRLVKRVGELRRDGTVRPRFTFAEESDWQSRLTEDEQHWLSALLEVDITLYQESRSERVKRLMTGISEVARLQTEGQRPESQKPKKKKVKAKHRRKQRELDYAD